MESKMMNVREVATGVVNLGNTCYMNAVLQALAHAPELCMAIECEPHMKECPIALKNIQRRMEENDQDQLRRQDSSDSPSPENNHENNTNNDTKAKTTSKSRSRTRTRGQHKIDEEMDEFCLLCEMEKHLNRVHSASPLDDVSGNLSKSTNNALINSTQNNNNNISNEAVAPSAFVNGFINHVAPWFKLGVQEDSHEFLRLLIDAMQKCCIKSRPKALYSDENNNNNNEDNLDLDPKSSQMDGYLDECQDDNNNETLNSNEYAFRLFRGTVKSTVTCSNCQHVSTKLDPIEDVGLEVLSNNKSTSSSGNGSISPVPTSSLGDVTSALEKFIATEILDSGYKCEKCHQIGVATKESRLASIPPILTLHLKRFRYGPSSSNQGSGRRQNSVGSSRRRNEAQLLASNGDASLFGGPTGSAKIEGHVKFEQVFDIRPYLTKEKQDEIRRMFCRLFAVIVHAGKNSHSGHYIAYVRNVAKNEWWKMDDAKVTRVPKDEVVSAEAYMLFYRVVDHPVAIELREMEREVKAKAEELYSKNSQISSDHSSHQFISSQNVLEVYGNHDSSCTSSGSKRKRDEPKFKSGMEWAKARTNLPDSFMSIFQRAEEYLSGKIDFKPEYSRLIMEEAIGGGKIGLGPSIGVSTEDIQGDAEVYEKAIWALFSKILPQDAKGFDNFFKEEKEIEDKDENTDEDNSSGIFIQVDASDNLL